MVVEGKRLESFALLFVLCQQLQSSENPFFSFLDMAEIITGKGWEKKFRSFSSYLSGDIKENLTYLHEGDVCIVFLTRLRIVHPQDMGVDCIRFISNYSRHLTHE